DADSGEPDRNHVAPLGFMKEVGQAIHEIHASVFIGWSHARPFDANRQKHKTEENEASHDQNGNAHEGTLRSAPDQNRPQPGWTLRFHFCFHTSPTAKPE